MKEDFTYWCTASAAMRQVGSKASQAWRNAIEGALLESQRVDGDVAGSWNPVGAWCLDTGRVYATEMAAVAFRERQSTQESR